MAAASPALLARGCVNVVGLDALKNQAGARWPRIRDGVHARMEALLRQKLGPTDFFVRVEDDSYLITMPSMEPEDVDVVCLRVAYDLYTSFLGQCDIGHIHISNASSGENNTLNLKPLAFDEIAKLAEKAGIQEFSLSVDLLKTGAQAPALASAERRPFALSHAVPKTTTIVVEHQYIPVWAVPNSVITTYICEPKTITVAETQTTLAITQLEPKQRVQVELSCLHAGINQLAKSGQKGIRFLLGITISFDVLGSPTGRMEFLTACHNLSAEYRQYLDFTLIEVPPGVAQTRLNNMTNMLRPFARSVSATVAPRSRIYSPYQGIGLRSIGFSQAEFTGPTQFRRDDATNLLQFAKTMKMGTFMQAVQNVESLKLAYATNIQLLSGPAIAPPCEEPHGMSRLTWNDILAHKFVSL